MLLPVCLRPSVQHPRSKEAVFFFRLKLFVSALRVAAEIRACAKKLVVRQDFCDFRVRHIAERVCALGFTVFFKKQIQLRRLCTRIPLIMHASDLFYRLA